MLDEILKDFEEYADDLYSRLPQYVNLFQKLLKKMRKR